MKKYMKNVKDKFVNFVSEMPDKKRNIMVTVAIAVALMLAMSTGAIVKTQKIKEDKRIAMVEKKEKEKEKAEAEKSKLEAEKAEAEAKEIEKAKLEAKKAKQEKIEKELEEKARLEEEKEAEVEKEEKVEAEKTEETKKPVKNEASKPAPEKPAPEKPAPEKPAPQRPAFNPAWPVPQQTPPAKYPADEYQYNRVENGHNNIENRPNAPKPDFGEVRINQYMNGISRYKWEVQGIAWVYKSDQAGWVMEWVGGSSSVKDWDRFRARVNETEIGKPNYVGKEGERTPTYVIMIWFGTEYN